MGFNEYMSGKESSEIQCSICGGNNVIPYFLEGWCCDCGSVTVPCASFSSGYAWNKPTKHDDQTERDAARAAAVEMAKAVVWYNKYCERNGFGCRLEDERGHAENIVEAWGDKP